MIIDTSPARVGVHARLVPFWLVLSENQHKSRHLCSHPPSHKRTKNPHGRREHVRYKYAMVLHYVHQTPSFTSFTTARRCGPLGRSDG